MYLGSTIEGKDMVNIFDYESELTSRLQNFGYIKLVANDNVFAGYPHLHLHLWGNIDFAKNYIKKCTNFTLL